MQRVHQLIFAAAFIGLCWMAMMAVHELGHVIGAMITGGAVERVVLHPLTISRTDVSPNPHPGIVVWLGPIIGCLLPLLIAASISKRHALLHNVAKFFAGFCLIANGAYIALGSFGRIGDCGEMIRSGTPLWAMLAFGIVTMPLGLMLWHRLGSIGEFVKDPTAIPISVTYALLGIFVVIAAAELAFSPR